ncbi:MAG: DedA family protein [Actinomycetota bacterium]|nr:DedA family protein [Actinomycetota bacterium]
MLDAITELARDAVTTAGYPGLFGAMVAENLFPPIPSEIVLPLAGFEAAEGNLAFVWAVLAATAGSLAGALILYSIGLYGGRPLVLRYGRVLRVGDAELDRAELWFERWGDWVVLGARLIPIARSVVSIPAGFARMPLVRFCLLTAIGSLIWNLILVTAGYQLGANWEEVSEIAGRYSDIIKVAFAAAFLAALVWAFRRWRRAPAH